MTLNEFYEAVGGNYNDVLSRLGKDDRIRKYLSKFSEGNDFDVLKEKLDEEDFKEAFRIVHSIKGMCLNLGLDRLMKSSSVLCEELRNGEPVIDITQMLADVEADYIEALEMIKTLDQ